MKILLLARSTLYNQPGGDTLQIEQTSKYLKALDVSVDIALAGEDVDIEKYDVVHFFNLFRPADILRYLDKIKHLVVSSIYVDYALYDRDLRGPFYSLLYGFFGKFGMEYLKTMGRWMRGNEVSPGTGYIFGGQRWAIYKVLEKADSIICASHNEIKVIRQDIPKINPEKFKVAHLGSEHFEPEPNDAELKNEVACVARIEGLKNQLNLIKALKASGTKLHLYGKAATNQQDYFRKCKKLAGENVIFHNHTSKEKLMEELPKYTVHCLPSFYETTGLSTIEALKAGCQVVVSDNDIQRELFSDHAEYCKPDSPASIQSAIQIAMGRKVAHRDWVQENFSWKTAAVEILDIYRTLINQS